MTHSREIQHPRTFMNLECFYDGCWRNGVFPAVVFNRDPSSMKMDLSHYYVSKSGDLWYIDDPFEVDSKRKLVKPSHIKNTYKKYRLRKNNENLYIKIFNVKLYRGFIINADGAIRQKDDNAYMDYDTALTAIKAIFNTDKEYLENLDCRVIVLSIGENK